MKSRIGKSQKDKVTVVTVAWIGVEVVTPFILSRKEPKDDG